MSVQPDMEMIRRYMPHVIDDLKKKGNIDDLSELEIIDYIIEDKPKVPIVRKFFRNHIFQMKIRHDLEQNKKISRSFY